MLCTNTCCYDDLLRLLFDYQILEIEDKIFNFHDAFLSVYVSVKYLY